MSCPAYDLAVALHPRKLLVLVIFKVKHIQHTCLVREHATFGIKKGQELSDEDIREIMDKYKELHRIVDEKAMEYGLIPFGLMCAFLDYWKEAELKYSEKAKKLAEAFKDTLGENSDAEEIIDSIMKDLS